MHLPRFSFRFRWALLIPAACAGLLLPGLASATTRIYLEVEATGATLPCGTGVTSYGGVDVTDSAEAAGFATNIVSPRDAGTGALTGKRQHRPVRVTKRVDGCSVLLQQAHGDGEELSVIARFFRLGGTGQPEHYFTIELHQAFVASSTRATMPTNAADDDMEIVGFVYNLIIWKDEITSTQYSETLNP